MWIKLFPYQEEALSKIYNGCILHGGVGSGKSLVSLMYYYISQGGVYNPENRVKMSHPVNLYIITTAKKRDSFEWEGELAPFGLSTETDICGYGNKVVVDSWNNIKKYIDVVNSFFIFDEQRVIGSGAWVKSFLKITKHNQWILLSATPGDTWTDYIPVFIANGYFRNRSEFINEHVIYKPFRNYPQIDRYIGIKRLERLRDNILIEMNRPKEVVSHEETVILDYDRDLYQMIFKNRFDPWKNEPIQNATSFSYCLRRVVNSDESRQVKLLELLEDHPRVIVFYSFDYELDILLGLQYPDGTIIAQWNGHKHQEIPDGQKWVYLVQYTSGCEGWNCIKTDTIIFYSQQHSYRVFEQAKGRIDRLNTPYTILYYYIFKSTASVDRSIAKALANKKNFNAGSTYGSMFRNEPISIIVPKPVKLKSFLKWVGGKTQLLEKLKKEMPKSYNRYYEPFIGGGAFLFEIQPKKAVIGDMNKQLINTYEQVRDNVEMLIRIIRDLDEQECDVARYMELRDVFNQRILDFELDVECAGLMIWLNKHCFNGLYRVNSAGLFNVPYNNKSSGESVDVENLRNVSAYLYENEIDIRYGDFEETCSDIESGDFVYFDSPYLPVSDTANFMSYTKSGFTMKDHTRLAEFTRALVDKGVKVMLSNNDVPLVHDLYEGFDIQSVDVRRAINSDKEKRTGQEVIIKTW